MSTWKQRVTAGIAAAMLAIGMLPAIAMGLTADTEISVTGIDAGDTANYYQVVQQNETTKAWELTTAFSSLDLTQTTKNKKINEDRAAEEPALPPLTTLDFILDGIDADEAALIAANPGTATGTLDPATYKATVAPGMYLVLVEPAGDNKDVVYKPIIVSADYDQTASPNTVNVSTATLPAPTTATAKKSPLTLTKTAATVDTKPNGVAVGDTVTFTVESNVPTYSGNFTDPVYKITDTLGTGLTMTEAQQSAISVTVQDYTLQDGECTITPSASGYTVTFDKSFLYRVTGNPKVTITYQADVTSDAPKQVNEMDNTVKLNFSNKPTDTTGQGELTDKTRHYTFDIDGAVFGGGSGGGNTKEVIKVGVDANGNVIEEVTTSAYTDPISDFERSLDGASFELRTNATEPSTAIKFKNGVKSSDADASATLTSANGGYITMKGLDEGTYYLVETAAPAGYSFDPTAYKQIKIEAEYGVDADGYPVLVSYKITVGGNVSEYVLTKDGQGAEAKPIPLGEAGAGITPGSDNETTLIINKKLGILPSTGGAGIYFYIVVGGAIAGAAAYFICKTKKEEEQLS